MYRNGQFHIPDGSKACASVMRRDFEYWGLDELDLEACCALKYYPDIEVCRVQKEKEIEENQRVQQEAVEAEAVFGQGKIAKCRTFLWDTFEKPWSSVYAKHYALFSLAVVVLSTLTFIISTQDEIQEYFMIIILQLNKFIYI